VDAATAARRSTIGGLSCTLAGPSTRAGTPCSTSNNSVRILDWAGVTVRTVAVTGSGPFYLSADGSHLAYQSDDATTTIEGLSPVFMPSCGWIDPTHILSPGFDVDGGFGTGKIGDITTGDVVDPRDLHGTCAGNVPGGL
jgi:hypothetical protein